MISPLILYSRLLSGKKIQSEEDAVTVMGYLQEKGPETVVLSSTNLSQDITKLVSFASTKSGMLYNHYSQKQYVHECQPRSK